MTNANLSGFIGRLLPPEALFPKGPVAPSQNIQPSLAPPSGSLLFGQGIGQFLPENVVKLQVPPATQGHANLAIDFIDSSAPISSAPQLALPPRSPGALTGSQFWTSVEKLGPTAREQAIQQEILSGNVPDHLRDMQAVNLKTQISGGETLEATAYVTPDYLAIGSNDDYVLVPMSPITAQAIADGTGTTLPTRHLVDAIYNQADIQLKPRPQDPGPQMTSIPYFARHDTTIQGQRASAGAKPGDLIAGHKKDVVITPRLDRKPGSVAIYGWHQSKGNHIQPLSTVHENTYADYSHGVRLVAPEININGQTFATVDVLRHPQWSALLSDEGVVNNPRAVRP